MLAAIERFRSPLFALMMIGCCSGSAAIAQDAAWHVGKSSGEVFVTPSGAQPVSISTDTTVRPGDYVRTGQTGRVLLVRGQESMLISPNSVIQIPMENRDGMSTTIVQRAGEVLFDVEKRNVKHFQVDTPYLAAVVKGTQFEVSVGRSEARVDVRRGQVEVRDYKSGQYALVNPQQSANVSAQGAGGLALSGSGALSPVQQGAPRSSPVDAVAAPEQRSAAAEPSRQPQTSAAPSWSDSALNLVPAAKPSATFARSDSATTDSWTTRIMPAVKSLDPRSWQVRAGGTDFDLGVPFAAGMFVAFAVAVKRGWQNRKKK